AVVVELTAQQPRDAKRVCRRLHCDLDRARLPVAQAHLVWVGSFKINEKLEVSRFSRMEPCQNKRQQAEPLRLFDQLQARQRCENQAVAVEIASGRDDFLGLVVSQQESNISRIRWELLGI